MLTITEQFGILFARRAARFSAPMWLIPVNATPEEENKLRKEYEQLDREHYKKHEAANFLKEFLPYQASLFLIDYLDGHSNEIIGKQVSCYPFEIDIAPAIKILKLIRNEIIEDKLYKLCIGYLTQIKPLFNSDKNGWELIQEVIDPFLQKYSQTIEAPVEA